jgi:hypothetical protein
MPTNSADEYKEAVEGIKKEWGENYERVPRGPSPAPKKNGGGLAIALVVVLVIFFFILKGMGII